jgi:hypothetical protein
MFIVERVWVLHCRRHERRKAIVATFYREEHETGNVEVVGTTEDVG